jgi:hypothetical protein
MDDLNAEFEKDIHFSIERMKDLHNERTCVVI